MRKPFKAAVLKSVGIACFFELAREKEDFRRLLENVLGIAKTGHLKNISSNIAQKLIEA